MYSFRNDNELLIIEVPALLEKMLLIHVRASSAYNWGSLRLWELYALGPWAPVAMGQYLYTLNLHLMKVLSLLFFAERLYKASNIFM